ncbi:MAG TPA: helix-turn-helix domain-containing protein, partial [Pseudomonas sp.]|nr:helix-turn-helix domain-containing protein [Pseudomonas sp.]
TARDAFERELIRQALDSHDGSVVEAARHLGLGRSTLYKKMLALGLSS